MDEDRRRRRTSTRNMQLRMAPEPKRLSLYGTEGSHNAGQIAVLGA